MNFVECIRFANENPVCYVATMDKDQPRVRGFFMWFANEKGFYFHTGAPKSICKQLRKNPKVEVCFYKPDEAPKIGKMMRVSGKAEFLKDRALKERLLEERPFLKDIAKGGADDPLLEVFRVSNGEAHFWTFENNMREADAERVKF